MQPDWPTPEAILPHIEQILEQHPDGLSEYELLTLLAKQLPFFAGSDRDHQDLGLFRRHFLLFHCLYLLEQAYRASQTGLLTISALEIRLLAYPSEGEAESEEENQPPTRITAADPVRDYYLDISQLQSTGKGEVDELLGRFWLALARHDARDEALALLGLSDPVDEDTIRKRYRQQVMQHHPDRGGDTTRIQQLNAAISNLLPKSS